MSLANRKAVHFFESVPPFLMCKKRIKKKGSNFRQKKLILEEKTGKMMRLRDEKG